MCPTNSIIYLSIMTALQCGHYDDPGSGICVTSISKKVLYTRHKGASSLDCCLSSNGPRSLKAEKEHNMNPGLRSMEEGPHLMSDPGS